MNKENFNSEEGYTRSIFDFRDGPVPPAIKQVGGDHYQQLGIDPIEVMVLNFTPEEYEGYLTGNILKYVMRYKHKNGVEDLNKASTYLNELIRFKEV